MIHFWCSQPGYLWRGNREMYVLLSLEKLEICYVLCLLKYPNVSFLEPKPEDCEFWILEHCYPSRQGKKAKFLACISGLANPEAACQLPELMLHMPVSSFLYLKKSQVVRYKPT